MKRWKIAAISVLVLILGAIEATSANSSGAPLGNTNAPGEQNCTSCHNSFGLNVGSGSINILGVPREFNPGQTYPIEIAAQDPNNSVWGFQVTVVNDKGDFVGSFTLTDKVITQEQSGNVGGKTRD